MTTEIVFRLILICIGMGALAVAVVALAKKKLTEGLCLTWGMFALLMLLAGIFLHPSGWNRYLSGRGLALLVLAGISLQAAAYFVSTGVSQLLKKVREAAIQVSLLNLEKERRNEERKELLLIIPAYNEEDNIGRLFAQLEASGVGEIADILVIDDGSSDRTFRKVKEAGYLCASGIFHQGYGSALLTGYKYAAAKGYPYVIQMDADGQHDVCNVEALYSTLRGGDGGGGPDIVLGSRFLPESGSFPISGVKMLAIRLFSWSLKAATGQKITDPTSGLQGLNARVAAFYAGYGCFDTEYPDANMLLQMLLLGYQIQEIPAVMHERRTGKSMHTGWRALRYMFGMAFSMAAVYIREKVLRKRTQGEASAERDV